MTKSKSAKSRTGKLLIAVGVVLLLSAGALYLHNVIEETSAAKSSEHAAQILLEKIAENQKNGYTFQSEPIVPTPIEPMPEAAEQTAAPEEETVTSNVDPVVEVEGQTYIGVLSIPTLKLQWPVNSEWSYSKLKLSPCRYSGSAEDNTLTIAAHNYRYHFGRFTNLEVGDKVLFTDITGKKYQYRIEEIETIDPTSVDEVINSKFDLNLFTCNYNGDARIAVKCKLYHNS